MGKKQSTLAGSIIAPMSEIRQAEAEGQEFVSETVKPQGKVRHFAPGMKPGRKPLAEGGKRNGEGESATAKHAPVVITEEGVKCGEWVSNGKDWTRNVAPVITAESVLALYAEAKSLPTLPAKDSAQFIAWAQLMRLKLNAEDAPKVTALQLYLASK